MLEIFLCFGLAALLGFAIGLERTMGMDDKSQQHTGCEISHSRRQWGPLPPLVYSLDDMGLFKKPNGPVVAIDMSGLGSAFLYYDFSAAAEVAGAAG